MTGRVDPERVAGEPLAPSDHIRALLDLMKPAGADLGRRWLAALLLVPEGERERVVEETERALDRRFGAAFEAERTPPAPREPPRAGGR